MSAFNREKWGAFLWETYRKEINSMVDDGYPEPDWNGVDHERQLAFRIAAETLACALAAADDNVAGRSDGYHTFAELYEHRHALFLALMASHPHLSWISTKHHDGTSLEGWFIAGIKTPCGDVSYHLPAGLWSRACATGAAVLETGMWWDGHTSAQVVDRLQTWSSVITARSDVARAERIARLESELSTLRGNAEAAFDAAQKARAERDAATKELADMRSVNRYQRGHSEGFKEAQEKYEAELAAVKAESLRYAHLLNEMARDLEKSRVQVAELKWEMGYVQEDAQDAWDRVISLVQERWAAGVKAERDEAMKGGSRG